MIDLRPPLFVLPTVVIAAENAREEIFPENT